MIDVTFTLNGVDWSQKLAKYAVDYEYEYSDTLTAIDGTEYTAGWERPVISFSLMPLTDAETKALHDCLPVGNIVVVYTDPNLNINTATGDFRMTTALSSVFGLRSIDGNRYYKGSTITLRRKEVL